MYRIFANNEILHNPWLAEQGRVVINPVLREKLNTHGSLQFTIAQTNPLYDSLEPRNTMIKVVSDTNSGNKPWFGRVVSVESGWKNTKTVYCEGVLAFLCDSMVRPFGFSGSPAQLFSALLDVYNGSSTEGPTLYLGNVSVTDPNNYIVRSSAYAYNVWESMEEHLFGSSLGGYILTRYDPETDRHYVDYLTLDDNDQYAHVSSQIVSFGRNLLDFTQHGSTEDVLTVLIPYGAQIEEGEQGHEDGPPSGASGSLRFWNGNRLALGTEGGNDDYIENADGIAMYGRVVGTKVWDDVTVQSNLRTKATAWLAQQIWKSVTLEMSAVDLAFVDADIEQIQVGDYVRCQSKPHDLNVLLLCTEKTTYLTKLEDSDIILGAGLKTITDLQRRVSVERY